MSRIPPGAVRWRIAAEGFQVPNITWAAPTQAARLTAGTARNQATRVERSGCPRQIAARMATPMTAAGKASRACSHGSAAKPTLPATNCQSGTGAPGTCSRTASHRAAATPAAAGPSG